MNAQEKHLLVNAINIRLERLSTILDANADITSVSMEENPGALADDAKLIDLAKQEKSDLLNNLEWLQSAEAGQCRDCGEEIPITRLLNIPTTRSCKTCTDHT